MKQIDIVDLFDRKKEKAELLDFLSTFDSANINQRKGIYILGEPGTGKTEFVKSVIPSDYYDIIQYDANDTRTKTAIPELIGNRSSNVNVLNLFYKKRKSIVTVMDEMDYMSSGDKGGIKELIKYVRPKKTRKQIGEPQTTTPIIFIGSNNNDKKIKELIAQCHTIKLSSPTTEQIKKFVILKIPDLSDDVYDSIVSYIDGNLQKFNNIYEIYQKNPSNFEEILHEILYKCNYNVFTKAIVKRLYERYVPISEYSHFVKETDRTTLGLLWHENIGSIVGKETHMDLYKSIIDNLCLADYIDRIIFQNQIWELSELNSFIKIFYNNFLLHNGIDNIKVPDEIIFTKVLTKYSTEYNNYCFFQQLEQKMFCDKKKILRLFFNKTDEELADEYYLSTLDIDRMRRFIKNAGFTCA